MERAQSPNMEKLSSPPEPLPKRQRQQPGFPGEKQKSRRNRMPLSCTICRKRKVKCDRGRPHCKVCEKYKVGYLCAYQEPTWANSDGENVKFLRHLDGNNTSTILELNPNSPNDSSSVSSLPTSVPYKTPGSTNQIPTATDSMYPLYAAASTSSTISTTASANTPFLSNRSPRDVQTETSDNGKDGQQHPQHPQQQQQQQPIPVTNYQKFPSFSSSLPYMGSFSSVNHLGSNERTSLSPCKPLDNNTREGRNLSVGSGITATPGSSLGAYTNGAPSQIPQQDYHYRSMTQDNHQNSIKHRQQSQQQLGDQSETNANKPVLSELQLLKEKIKQIEASIAVADLAQPRVNSQPPSNQFTLPPPPPSSFQYRTPLPPIQSWPNKAPSSNGSHYNLPSLPAPSPSPSPYSASQATPTITTDNKQSPYASTTLDGATDLTQQQQQHQSTLLSMNSISSVTTPEDKHASTSHLVEGTRALLAISESGMRPNDRINFYEGYTPMILRYSRVNNHGPLAWVTMIKKDPFLKPMWFKLIEYKKNKKIYPFNLKTLPRELNTKTANDAEFEARVFETDGKSDIQPYGQTGDAKKSLEDTVIHAGEKGRKESALGISAHKKDPESRTVASILKVLPCRKVIWLLVDRYFRFIYPFLPYLDEPTFISDLERILGARALDDSMVISLRIDKRLDFATIGILLIVFRFAYLSLLSNNEALNKDESTKTEDEKFLLKNPINMEIINIAQLCLNQFKLLRRCALNIFQCALMMKEYHKYAPEDGSDGYGDGDSLIFTGMLIQMGISIGLNRDPSSFESSTPITRLGNLWRKIWYKLVSADNFQAFQLGNPNLIRREFYDTEIPTFDAASANIRDLELEKAVIESIQSKFKLEILMSNVSSLVLNIREQPRLEDLLTELTTLETYLRKNHGCLRKIMTPDSGDHNENIKKVNEIVSYCEALSLIHPVYYHIFLFYQGEKNLQACNFLLGKILKIIVEIIASFVDLLKYSHKYVGFGFDLILTPTLEASMQKSLQFQFSIYIRALQFKRLLTKADPDGNKDLLQALDNYLNNSLLYNIEYYLQGLKLISGKYFYAWRMSKAQNLILTLFKNIPMFEEDYGYDDQMNIFEGFKVDDFETLSHYTSVNLYKARVPYPPNVEEENKDKSANPSATAASAAAMVQDEAQSTSSSNTFTYETTDEVDNFWFNQLYKTQADSLAKSGGSKGTPMKLGDFGIEGYSPGDSSHGSRGSSNGNSGNNNTGVLANGGGFADLFDSNSNEVDFDQLLNDGRMFPVDLFTQDLDDPF